MAQEVRSEDRASHWESVYAQRGVDRVSWYQPSPEASLRLIDALGLPPDAAIVDVGGGASTLVDHLLAHGRSDLAVLDISALALQAARERVGHLGTVAWIREDLLTWRPSRRYALWHDRAAFHFLVESAERTAYLDTLDRALAPAGAVIIGTFAPDGPQECSGLAVARYAPDGLASALGPGFEVVETLREQHTTPAGSIQPFTWVAARRTPNWRHGHDRGSVHAARGCEIRSCVSSTVAMACRRVPCTRRPRWGDWRTWHHAAANGAAGGAAFAACAIGSRSSSSECRPR